MKQLITWLNYIIKKQRALKKWQRMVMTLAAVITFATTYALILPAITVEKNNVTAVSGMYLDSIEGQEELHEENAIELTDIEEPEFINAPEIKTLKAYGRDYTVTLTCDETSGLPQEATLDVSEIAQDSDEYQTYLEETKKAMGLTEEETLPRYAARFFDIKIMVGEEEFTPSAGVSVEISYAEPLAENPDTEVNAVHFADDSAEAELVDANATELKKDGTATVEFTAESFSVYGVIYTVDFEYSVNGKMYEFSIPGGGFVSFTDLVEVLGIIGDTNSGENGDENGSVIAENAEENTINEGAEENGVNSDTNTPLTLGDVEVSEATRKFVENVASVEFSSPELVDVSKVESETTVGQIKNNRGLECEYSAELTEEQIAEINAQTVEARDWALISMKAFDTEEKLTITMNTGESFDIIVTDAQDAVMNGDVVQTISNPAGTTIDLFDYWIVSQNLVGRDGWGDLNQSQGSAEAGDDKPLNGTGNNKGINSSPLDSEHGHALKFSPAWSGTVYNGNKIGTTGNAWQSVNLDMRDGLNSYTGDEYTWHWNCPNPFTGIVQNNLYNGYPILTNNQNIGTNGESLAYLFDPSISHDGKASYDGVNQLLYVDKDGYYTYDSRDYAASFNTGDRTFTLTEQTSSNSEIRGFWPFGTQNFWTGMHVNTQFSMPSGGQVLNPSGVLKPMKFEFSGDDDVWIYVDGILIGDAGGIHNRTEVDINFQTGIVSISGSADKYIDDLFRVGLRDQGKTEAEIEEYITNNYNFPNQ